MAYCDNCSANIRDDISQCPICGRAMSTTEPPPPRIDGGMRLSFTVFGCDECEAVYTLDGGLTQCPECGAVHDGVDEHVVARVAAYSEGLRTAAQIMRTAELREFVSRGP